MNSIIEIKNLSKIYDEVLSHPTFALKNIDFSMEKGEFVCIMGPSGAGKTTLLNCISLTDTPSQGNVQLDGQDVHSLSSRELTKLRYQKLGLVFQKANLLHYLTIYENIAFPLTLFNEKTKDIDDKVQQVARNVGIEELLKKYPFECSGGQNQRAGICRAIVNNPSILIADEPTGNLDSENSHEIMRLFQSLNNQGMSILMVTHDPMIASYSHRVIYIKDGEIKMEVSRENKTQNEYFYEIVKMNSKESLIIME
ncbi:ABC transporter ATP-binding protein [Allocoprobacillus halotolerans]|uniref:ABC transporter ATP-binding protein n=1 Tax=Allocoprobacillus halotolerans TaxID=2944914 RepID=A0ABY5I383_9FIRM|nr:ABC transporter ATP-binding protein [Allocoprobacillus halotolerans]UTY39786.1 ABC transporter ATP-binding protein [Allocoprobacillus halotolerans]